MRLKSIKASGFKSFADKIELDIHDGITCIVGPNGSGKSNVVDAVRWVLGEQSVKSLRGTGSMSDVIFAGSKTRNAMSRAMVSLTLDNSDHYLNSEFSELEIKRVVYKSGENEYYINNAKARLKDIIDLFMDSGAGKESFNIISQGSVEDIVNSKPEARRSIFEEAAGVLKYKRRKEESLKKLEKTNDNLERVELLIKEIETQLEPLREQSKIAKQYLEYKTDLENVEVSLIVHDIKTTNDEYNKIKAKNESLKTTLEEMDLTSNKDTAKLETLKLENIRLDEAISKSNDELMGLEKRLAELQAQKQLVLERQKYEVEDAKLQENIVLLKEEELNLKKNITTLEQEIKNITDEFNKVKDEKDSLEEELLKVSKKKYTLNNEEAIKNKELLDIKNKIEIINDNILNDVKLPLAVKSVLNNPRLHGIHKTIIKLLDIPDKYISAIETSLGANSNVIVVNDTECAKMAINYLKDNKLGRATFFPMNIIKPRSVDNETLKLVQNEIIGVASDIVKYDKKYEDVIKNQLGNTLIVKDIDTLNKVGRQIKYKYKIVSLDGEIQYTNGALTGGVYKNNNSLASQKLELNNLLKKRDTLEQELELIAKDLNKVNETNDGLNKDIETNQKSFIEIRETLNRKNISFNELKSRYEEKAKELEGTTHVKENSLDQELENIMEGYSNTLTKKELLVQELGKLKSTKSDTSTLIAELEQVARKVNSEYNQLKQELNRNEIALGKMDVKLDNYLLNLNENYNMTYEGAMGSVDLEIDMDSARLQVNKLKSAIKALGEVNTGSIAEYERVNTRYVFLTEQSDDLKTSVLELHKVIEEMDNIMTERFIETFNKINTEFKSVFKTLFRGGEGHLELTDPDNLLETGIEISAQPPGKKLNSIMLFSGGERTLTAIALLFAILNVKTVPFVILDEVEAALDEANVDVFGKYLETKKDKSQFIIITHKKRTMEYADCLYGITMQEQGVSKLVSVRLED